MKPYCTLIKLRKVPKIKTPISKEETKEKPSGKNGLYQILSVDDIVVRLFQLFKKERL